MKKENLKEIESIKLKSKESLEEIQRIHQQVKFYEGKRGNRRTIRKI